MVETFFLRLLRGAGPRGLAGIPEQRACGKGFIFRPFLDVPAPVLRAAVEAADEETRVRWVAAIVLAAVRDARFRRAWVPWGGWRPGRFHLLVGGVRRRQQRSPQLGFAMQATAPPLSHRPCAASPPITRHRPVAWAKRI